MNQSTALSLPRLNQALSSMVLERAMFLDDVLKQRYGDSIHYEVLNELIQESYPKELQAQELKPASSPAIRYLERRSI